VENRLSRRYFSVTISGISRSDHDFLITQGTIPNPESDPLTPPKTQREVEEGFRADPVMNGLVMIELKSVNQLAKVHKKQLLTYLRLMDRKLGLLINFGEKLIKDGISRVVNGLDD